jgi:hypothetical protein
MVTGEGIVSPEKSWRAQWLAELSCCFLPLIVLLVSIGTTSFAQAIRPLAQQWAEKRIEREQTIFLARSWQIKQSEYTNRIRSIDAEIRQIYAEVRKQPRDQQAQIRQQSDNLFNVRIAPLRTQWQTETAVREKEMRAALAADAEQAGRMQAQRTLLLEKLERREISQAEFSRQDQTLEQSVLAMQNKWTELDSRLGALFTQTWQRVQKTALPEVRKTSLPEVRKKELTAADEDVSTLAGIALEIRHNEFLRDTHAISPEEEQERNAVLRLQMSAVQAKYSGEPAKDLANRTAKLVDERSKQLRPQWEAEARALSGRGSPPTRTPPTPPPGGGGGSPPGIR